MAQRSPSDPTRILLVEDTPPDALVVRAALAEDLTDGELEIRHVDSVTAARAALEEEGTDVILLDLNLPDSGGLATVERVRSFAGEIPIIALTGVDDEKVEANLVQAGGEDFVPKEGLSRELLLRTVRYAVDRREREREARELRERLAEAHRLESLGRLAGGVSHRFNNILMSVVGTASLLRERLDDPADQDDLDLILHEMRQAQALTRRLLSFGHRQELEPRPVELGATVRELAPLLAPLLGESVDLAVAVESEGWVHVDPGLLEQVVVTLGLHAREWLTEDRTLHFRVAAVEDEGGGTWARLQVGHPAAAGPEGSIDELPRLLEGLGPSASLSLQTIARLVDSCGGSLEVGGLTAESGSGSGAGCAFVMDIPRTARPARSPDSGASPTTTRTGRVLFVEDEDAVRRVGQRILRRLGLDVTSAQDGREALQALRTMEPAPDLVVTDVLMPRVSGPEFVRRMRKEGVTVPVLFVSGYSATELEDYDLNQGAAFLAKPFTPEELGIKVAELLGPEADGAGGDAGDAGDAG